MFKKQTRIVALLGGLAVGLGGCLDLDVTNTQQPDRSRALAEPSDVESLIAGSFNIFYRAMGDRWEIMPVWLNCGVDATSTHPWWATVVTCAEPRESFNNDSTVPNFTGPRSPRILWADLNEMVSNVHDGLRAIDEDDLTFTDENGRDQTVRAVAFAKFLQGIGWGYLATLFDQAVIIPETEALASSGIRDQVVESLTPRDEALQAALGSLDAAIQLAGTSSFTFPEYPASRLWFGTPTAMSNAKFAELANTMAARFLVVSARTPAERQSVDWQRVLQYTSKGLTTDFEVQLASGYRNSSLMWGVQTATPGFSSPHRLNYRVIGPADVSGRYQAWIKAPLGERNRFEIVTPDRRITGPTPTSNGAYTRYRSHDRGYNPADGLYRFSAYQWSRNGVRFGLTDGQYNTNTFPMATADENRLLRAEALLRTGDRAGAATLINVTRTRPQRIGSTTYPGLPPVTAAGVPQSADCVPRTDAGECGDLLTALRYERMLELLYLDFVRGYADARGFGILPDGTWLQQPVPGNELEVLGLPGYTFGGVGSTFGAVYSPGRL